MRGKLRLLSGVMLAGVGMSALSGCWWTPQKTVENQSTTNEKITSVRLDNGSGAVTLKGEKGVRHTLVKRKVRYKGDKPGATHKVEDGVLVLKGCGNNCTVEYTVDLPAGLPVTGKTGSGAITLSAMDSVQVTTSNGRVKMKDISGDVQVKTNNGRVEGTRLAGARISAETSNGDVTLAASEPRDVRIKTSNGGIDLAVPDVTYDVSTETSNGSEDVDVDSDATSKRRIDLSTSNGSIKVRPN